MGRHHAALHKAMAPNDPVLYDHERRLARLEEARRSLDETLIVVGEIDRQTSAVLQEHGRLIVTHERALARVDGLLVGIGEKLSEMGEKLSEMTDKLNGLIGWAASTVRRPNPPGEVNGPQV